jgi:L-alanine-DL-glutamate epimerase-like enolase superfamily enzyme
MKITAIRTTPLALLFKEPYHWAGRCDLGATVILVEVETDAGIVGIGEVTADRPAAAVLACLEGVAPLFIGASPFDVEALTARARQLGGFNTVPRFANLILIGLEMALWDIIGKSTDLPVYQLLGGAYRREIDYFAFLQGDRADQLAQDAQRAVDAGYSVIYMKVGRGEQLDLANVAAVRQVIGDRRLRLDGNEAWDACTAIYMIRQLERFNPEFIEQPTPCMNLYVLKQVKDAVGVPIAADQSVFTMEDVYQVCRLQAADVIVLSPHETGGLLAFKKAAAVAEAAGIRVCLHGQFVTGISDCAQHQVGLTIPNLTDGNQIMHQLLAEDILAAPDLTPQQGKLGLPERPGLGFSLNHEAVQRAARRYRGA